MKAQFNKVKYWVEDNPKKAALIGAAVAIVLIGIMAGHGVG